MRIRSPEYGLGYRRPGLHDKKQIETILAGLISSDCLQICSITEAANPPYLRNLLLNDMSEEDPAKAVRYSQPPRAHSRARKFSQLKMPIRFRAARLQRCNLEH